MKTAIISPIKPDLQAAPQAAIRVGISERTMRKLIAAGLVPNLVRVGRRVLVPTSWVPEGNVQVPDDPRPKRVTP